MSSVSSYNNYEECPHSAQLKVRGYKSEMTDALLSGIKSHEFLQEYGKHLKENQLYSDEEFFYKKLNEYKVKYSQKLNESDHTLGEDIYFAVNNAKDFIFVSDHSTRHFELEFCYDHDMDLIDWVEEGHFFRGRIDDTTFFPEEKKALIIDYKTGMGRNMSKRQLIWYAVILMDCYPDLEKVETGWYFSRRTGYAEPEYFEGPTLYKKDFDSVMTNLKKCIKDYHDNVYKEEDLEARVGEACVFCGYKAHCKYLAEYKESELIKDPQKLYARITAYDIELKNMKKILKKMMEKNESIDIGNGYEYKIIKKETLNLNKEYKTKVLEFIKEVSKIAKIPISEIINSLSLTPKQISTIVNFVSEQEELEDFTMTKIGTSLKAIKKGGKDEAH